MFPTAPPNSSNCSASVNLSAANGETHTYRATYNPANGQLSVWRDGVFALTWTDSTPLTSGNHIAFRTQNSSVRFDNIRATTTTSSLYYFFTDHLGSTSVLSDSSGNEVAGSRTRHLPFGGWRGTAPTQTVTDRAFTGQKENMEVGLLYFNARYYLPNTNRMISPDTIVPNPANPQSYNRYSYVLNSPLNFTDPTGHRECGLEGIDCDNPESHQPSPNSNVQAGAMSTSCADCVWTTQFGDMGRAYDVFVALEREIGRSVTYTEVLAIVAQHEFGWTLTDQNEYDVALEAMGRQFYNFCGPEGGCQGDELWKFLGAHQSWFDGDPHTFAQELSTGTLPARNFAGARTVLNQPDYDYTLAPWEQSQATWRSGNGAGDIPFVYGNYSMFSDDGVSYTTLRSRGVDGINGNGLATTYLNKPDVNGLGGNGYVVMTMGQYKCTIGTGPCQ